MRVVKLSDGTSWVARIHEAGAYGSAPVGWDAILFEQNASEVGPRMVYRPKGWLSAATAGELMEALAEGVVVRVRWGD